jgi:FtsP/CotA-like multicopper oxidase with cupredoxin domain
MMFSLDLKQYAATIPGSLNSCREANMSDRTTISTNRREFLNGLMTTTALVASGSALAQTHHGSHGAPRVRAPAALATQAHAPAAVSPSQPFLNPPAITGANANYALDIVMRQANLGGQPIFVRAYIDPDNPPPPSAPLVGPTITLTGNGQPIQPVSVKLTNRLPLDASSLSATPATTAGTTNDNPHGFNTTNLHTHGLHVDPIEDNVYVELSPSVGSTDACLMPIPGSPLIQCTGSYTYKYNFGKTPNGTTKIPAGTYWYHPHKHGSVGLQVASGMAGAFIVKGDLDNIPGVRGLTEQVMVVQFIEYSTPTSLSLPLAAPAVVDPTTYYNGTASNGQYSINGLVNPTVTMQYGEIQRWRIINATAEQFFYLNVGGPSVDPNAVPTPAQGPAPVLYAIAVDGVPLTNTPPGGQPLPQGISVPFRLGTPTALLAGSSVPSPESLTQAQIQAQFSRAVTNEIAILAPAQRLDLLVQAPPAPPPGPPVPTPAFTVQAVIWPQMSAAPPILPAQTILSIQMQGTKNPADRLPASSAFNSGALVRPTIAAQSPLPTTPTQNIQFGFLDNGNGTVGAISNAAPVPPPTTILGPFAPTPTPPQVSATPFALPPAAQLNLRLNAVDLWNVVSANGGPHSFHIHINSFMMTQRNGIDISTAKIWRDTARIDQTNTSNLQDWGVQFVSQQLDYMGLFVLHCHVLDHEDAGMMWSVGISP